MRLYSVQNFTKKRNRHMFLMAFILVGIGIELFKPKIFKSLIGAMMGKSIEDDIFD